MRAVKLTIIATALALTTGCASIVGSTTQTIDFKSTPDGANIVIKDEAGIEIHKGTTPTNVTLQKGAGYFKSKTYTVEFTKPGFGKQTVQLTSGVSGWYVGNILFGGLIGFLIVDPITGAMWSLNPDNVTASLQADATKVSANGKTINVALLEDIPAEMRGNLIRISE